MKSVMKKPVASSIEIVAPDVKLKIGVRWKLAKSWKTPEIWISIICSVWLESDSKMYLRARDLLLYITGSCMINKCIKSIKTA